MALELSLDSCMSSASDTQRLSSSKMHCIDN